MSTLYSYTNAAADAAPTLIPEPKQMRYDGMLALASDSRLVLDAGEVSATGQAATGRQSRQPARSEADSRLEQTTTAIAQTALHLLRQWLEARWDGAAVESPFGLEAETASSASAQGYRIVLECRPTEASADGSEAYTIRSNEQELRITGAARGLLYGVQTLTQLLSPRTTRETLAIPLVDISDQPDMAIRGIFAESFWGPDLMEMEDWREMVDRMASFKMNTLMVGIYGCWPARYPLAGNSPSEFLNVPVLEGETDWTPERKITYFNPHAGAAETKHYTPALYGDGFGELIRYAAARGIRVVPQFNGPGHNLLIPRLYPHISALNAEGQPKLDGYSLTHPDTFPLIKRMLKRVVENDLLPNGLTWFHIGMDEISNWCSRDLRTHTPRQLFELYLVEIGGYLLELGMEKIIIWHDMGMSLTEYDEAFDAFLARSGLAGRLVIHWWGYTMPVFDVKRVAGAESWMAPSTGWLAPMFYQDCADNIENRLNEGAEIGASGAVSYMMYASSFRRNVAYLAEKSWNLRRRDNSAYDRQYAGWMAASDTERWTKAMGDMRRLFEYSPAFVLLQEIGVFSGNGDKTRPYPSRIIRSMLATGGTHKAFQVMQRLAKSTLQGLASSDQGATWPDRGEEPGLIRFECHRVIGLTEAILSLADAVRDTMRLTDQGQQRSTDSGERLAAVGRKLRADLAGLDSLLREMGRVLPPYMAYVAWREYSFLREAMRAQAEQIERLAADPALRGETLVSLK